MCLMYCSIFFFFNDTATTEIYTLSLHDALPISPLDIGEVSRIHFRGGSHIGISRANPTKDPKHLDNARSEEHTSELQSRLHLVCRLLLEKKKNNIHLNAES